MIFVIYEVVFDGNFVVEDDFAIVGIGVVVVNVVDVVVADVVARFQLSNKWIKFKRYLLRKTNFNFFRDN